MLSYGQEGFSLTELMVAVAIMGTLATIGAPNYQNYVLKGKHAQARAEMAGIKSAILAMNVHTMVGPGGIKPTNCTSDLEIWDVSACSAGLVCTDGSFGNWRGPYYFGPVTDPWDRPYYIDYDYYMTGTSNPWIAVIGSYGENGAQDYDQTNPTMRQRDPWVKFCVM
jgi:prepilin-type N-terminal cleavage/methylation domain-containing protein